MPIPYLPFMLKISNQCPMVVIGLFALFVGLVVQIFIPYVPFIFYLVFLYFITWAFSDYVRFDLLKFRESLDVPESNEKLSPIEIIKKRKSNRAFKRRYLTKRHEEYIKDLVNSAEKHEDMRILYLKKAFKRCTFITDAWQFLICLVPKKYNDEHIKSVGYVFQKIILEATKANIATCWVGGFRGGEITSTLCAKKMFDIKHDHVAVLVAMGYESNYLPHVIQKSYIFSRGRKPFSSIFFKAEKGKAFGNPLKLSELDEKMQKVVECTRDSPTASNMQDVRVIQDGKNSFHFFKVGPSNYYAPMNTGIYMANWEYTCKHLQIEGKFEKITKDNIMDFMNVPQENAPHGTKYFTTWVTKQ